MGILACALHEYTRDYTAYKLYSLEYIPEVFFKKSVLGQIQGEMPQRTLCILRLAKESATKAFDRPRVMEQQCQFNKALFLVVSQSEQTIPGQRGG